MAGKLHRAADLKFPAADGHVHLFASKKHSRNIVFKGRHSVSPNEDVVNKFAGEGESTDDLVGLTAPNVRASAAALRGAEEAIAPGREEEGGEEGGTLVEFDLVIPVHSIHDTKEFCGAGNRLKNVISARKWVNGERTC